jgi:hypothetical protein
MLRKLVANGSKELDKGAAIKPKITLLKSTTFPIAFV